MNPLQGLVTHWLKKIRLAWDCKQKDFGEDAEEAMRFFDGPYDFLYRRDLIAKSRGFLFTGGEDEDLPRPTFGMTVNKVAEMVQIFGPVLYHRNPIRQVNPRTQPELPPELFQMLAPPPPQLPPNLDPQTAQQVQMMYQQQIQQQIQTMQQQMVQQQATDTTRAILLSQYLNYTPNALNLKEEARWAIDEAIIKGMGCLWTELYQPPGSSAKMVGSFYDSVDNLVIDTDMESLRDAKWIARRCVHPVWEVEDEYGLPRGTIRGTIESHNRQAEIAGDTTLDWERKQGESNDLLVYWKIYSRMGAGGRLSGVASDLREPLEAMGNYCYLVVCSECEFPLNISPDLIENPDVNAIKQALQWPTPFWADDAWPFTPIVFHPRPRHVWPMSHLKPGMGELKFINWVYSFIAGKIKTACRDFLAIKKSVGEELTSAIISGTDYELIKIDEQYGTISEVVQFLQHPSFHGDIWRVLEAVEQNFEKRVGLTELMYGMSNNQMRSAQEAQVKASQLQIRPDDMAEKVETSMTFAARREALAVRWHLVSQDVAPIMGPVAAQLWDRFITPSNPAEVLFQLEYRIEAGSVRKPNRDRDLANANQAIQTLFQPFFQYAMQTGNVGPVNAILTMWGKANDFTDYKQLLLSPPPPPQPPQGPPPGQGENEQGGADQKEDNQEKGAA